MLSYTAETVVKVTIPFRDSTGNVVVPTALSYLINDEADESVLVATSIPVFDANAGEYEITIGIPLNTLAVDATAGYRRVDLLITVGADSYVQSEEYLLMAVQQLVICKNSFQTYEQAILRSFNMGELVGWGAATKDSRIKALAKAYDALAAFKYRLVKTDDSVILGDPRMLTVEEFTSLIPLEQEDFCKAQIAQADYYLGGSPIEKDISEGLQSSTIGEVSQFYRPRPSLITALSRMALYYVGRYIHWNIEIGRA